MTYNQFITTTLTALKFEHKILLSPVIPIYRNYDYVGFLRCLSVADADDYVSIGLLADWRRNNDEYFPAQFTVTHDGTAEWFVEQVLSKPDRILFFVYSQCAEPIGHLGLNRFDYAKQDCSLDNVIRGVATMPGLMTDATRTLIKWAKQELLVDHVTLEVFSDNAAAMRLYERAGFVAVKRVPLRSVISKQRTTWVEDSKQANPKRYNVYMSL